MKVIRVNHGQFSKDGLRAGDLIALGNFLEYIRKDLNDQSIFFWIPPESLEQSKHVKIMLGYLYNHTNYFVINPGPLLTVHVKPGTDPTYPDLINLWNIREDVLEKKQDVIHIPDAVKIKSYVVKEQKIVIAPLTDAAYNTDRNWTLKMIQTLVFQNNNHFIYDKRIIACKQPIDGLNLLGFEYCHNYEETLKHIATCSKYIGGDTGLSHFAGAQKVRPPIVEYYYPTTTYGTTNPFYWKITGGMSYYE